MKNKPQSYHERHVIGDYGSSLRGLGGTILVKQRGLRGITLGPANTGRKLSDAEREAIERQMRKDGKL